MICDVLTKRVSGACELESAIVNISQGKNIIFGECVDKILKYKNKMTYFVYENVSSCSCKFINGEIYEFLIVVCLRFALIIITWQINNYYVLNHFIQLLLVFRFHFIVII